VRERVGKGEHFLHGVLAWRQIHPGTRYPLDHVDAVNGLVHQRPTAVERTGPLPRIAVVVVFPPPWDGSVTDGEVAESTFDHGVPDRLDDGIVPLLEDPSETDVRFRRRRDHLVDALGRYLQWFLTEDVDPAFGRFDGGLQVGPARCRDGEHVDVLTVEQLRRVRVPVATELFGEFLSVRFGATRPGDERRRIDVADRPGVHFRD